ncbi:jg23511 [Pararge aegeria aegeria]|uniref:Jg23511 protein n=1 Tax=Pararge aegeria aegeria TaxID=348720 RepID=A0A8S4QUN9_9NEOP|nr:jg23511 [Pararge aegeria aegeria]
MEITTPIRVIKLCCHGAFVHIECVRDCRQLLSHAFNLTLGHNIARKENSWCKRLFEWKPWGEKSPQGRPQKSWKDDVKKVADSNRIHTVQCRERKLEDVEGGLHKYGRKGLKKKKIMMK